MSQNLYKAPRDSPVHGNAGQANYAASKAGMIALAKSIAQELGSRGIRANAIANENLIQTEEHKNKK